MSTPARPTAQPAPRQAGTSAPTATPATAPAPAPATTASPSPRTSTPRLLRLARGLATAAALLTGVVATGTFDTDGVNSTPNVIADQWVAAEEARVEIARADLAAAQNVAQAVAGEDGTVDLEQPLVAAADAHARAGGADERAGATAGDLVRSGLLARDAVDAAANPEAAVEAYSASSALARDATASVSQTAEQHATDLQTGSRSVLTATVGVLSTALLLAILVWLALRTRRIVNLPLLVAAGITGWLTYVSLNPAALPLSFDNRVDGATAAATALQEVREARQAEYATVLGVDGVDLQAAGREAAEAVDDVGLSDLPQVWDDVVAGHEAVTSADGTAAGLEALRGTEAAYAEVDQRLQALLDERLEPATRAVGTPATVTSGVALLLGLVAAAAAWTGLTRRLQDYR